MLSFLKDVLVAKLETSLVLCSHCVYLQLCAHQGQRATTGVVIYLVSAC